MVFLFSWMIGAYLCFADAPVRAAEVGIGPVPVIIGESEEGRGTVEIDMSGVPATDEETLSDSRPSQDVPRRERPRIQAPSILSISVEGNSEVVTEHILSVVTSKVGAPFDQNRLAKDADAIFEQGFYSNVDYRITD